MKELFLKLDETKQKRILDVGVEEFSVKLFNEASVNQIIKSAGIARGSFYLYFEDKLDFYCYILDMIFEDRTIAFIMELFESKQTDFLAFFRELFRFNLGLLTADAHKNLFRNLYLGINKEVKGYLDSKRDSVRIRLINRVSDLVPLSLKSNPKRLKELINIILLIQRDLFVEGIVENMSNEDLLSVYDLRISLLKTE